MEVFGTTVGAGTAGVGQGIHPFRDPMLREDFSAEPRPLDVAEPHTYSVEWAPGRVEFRIDGTPTRVADRAPDYPMMLILGLFDFPDEPGDPTDVPHFRVTEVSGANHGPDSHVAGA